jgi:hypothetical protein
VFSGLPFFGSLTWIDTELPGLSLMLTLPVPGPMRRSGPLNRLMDAKTSLQGQIRLHAATEIENESARCRTIRAHPAVTSQELDDAHARVGRPCRLHVGAELKRSPPQPELARFEHVTFEDHGHASRQVRHRRRHSRLRR